MWNGKKRTVQGIPCTAVTVQVVLRTAVTVQGSPCTAVGRWLWAAVLLFVLSATYLSVAPQAAAADVPLSISGDTVTVIKTLPFKITAPETKGALYDWRYPSSVKADENDNVLTVTSAPTGEVTVQIKVTVALLDKDGKFVGFSRSAGKLTFTVGAVPPGPLPPDPKPPDPKPPVPNGGPAPIPLEGFRVLMIEDAPNRGALPPSQLLVLFGAKVRDYIEAQCTTGKDGKTKEWRIWPDGVDVSKAEKHWQDAYKRPRKSLPWIIVSNGKTGYEGPLPATEDDAIALFKKYATPTRTPDHNKEKHR